MQSLLQGQIPGSWGNSHVQGFALLVELHEGSVRHPSLLNSTFFHFLNGIPPFPTEYMAPQHSLSYKKCFLLSMVRWNFGWWSVFHGSMSFNTLPWKNATFNSVSILSLHSLHLPRYAWGKKKSIKIIHSYDIASPSPLQIRHPCCSADSTKALRRSVPYWGDAPGWESAALEAQGATCMTSCPPQRWAHKWDQTEPNSTTIQTQWLQIPCAGENSQQQTEELRKQERWREAENVVCRFCLPRAFILGFTIKNI